jgi:hypothetical protein
MNSLIPDLQAVEIEINHACNRKCSYCPNSVEERKTKGRMSRELYLSIIEQVEIPVVDKDVQHQISLLIQESFRLKKESEQLLDLAKRAVEVAIEEGEEKAMEMIENHK